MIKDFPIWKGAKKPSALSILNTICTWKATEANRNRPWFSITNSIKNSKVEWIFSEKAVRHSSSMSAGVWIPVTRVSDGMAKILQQKLSKLRQIGFCDKNCVNLGLLGQTLIADQDHEKNGRLGCSFLSFLVTRECKTTHFYFEITHWV